MKIRRAPGILTSDFPRAKVVFNTATRMPYILNGTASEIWGLCEKPKRAEDLIKYLRVRYAIGAVRAKKDVDGFIKKLKRRGLLD